MKNLRVYSMLVTAGLAMNISGQLIWSLCPKLDIIDTTAWSIFIALAAAMIFIVLTEPEKKRTAKWTRVNGIEVMVQRHGNQKRKP